MLTDLKEAVFKANLDLAKSGLVIMTFGNVSGIDRRKGIVAIKPSGVAYDAMKADDIVLVDLEGQVVEGWLNPSSDTPTHCRDLQGFPRGRRRRPRPQRLRHDLRPGPAGDPLLRHDPRRHLPRPHSPDPPPRRSPRSTRATSGTRARSSSSASPAWTRWRCPAALVAGHGPFAWGKTPAEAVETVASSSSRWPPWPSGRSRSRPAWRLSTATSWKSTISASTARTPIYGQKKEEDR